MSKPYEFGQTVFIFLSVLGVAWWGGTIYMAKGEDKLAQSCLPIELSTDALHKVSTALIGYPPRWTLYLQSYLMSGCLYFSKTMIDSFGGRGTSGDLTPEGGLRVE
jgi:hypothetical protein